MGKKKGKQKSKAAATPKDDRTLPFLQEMFPNIEKDIVSIIFEQNEYDAEKTMHQLEELSLDDGTRPALSFCDENDLLSGIVDVDLNALDVSSTSTSASTSTKPTISNTSNNASKRHTLPKSTPFISTYDEYNIIPNNNHYSYSPNSNLQDTVATPLTFHSQFATSLTPSNPSSTPITTTATTTKPSFTTSTTTSTGATLTSKYSQSNESEGGESKHFLASMFPEVDSTMVALLYDENGNDVGKTVESLLSIVFMNYSGESSGAASDEEEEDEERSNEDIIGDGDEFEEVPENISGEEDSGYDLEHMEDFQVEIPPSNTTIGSENSDAVKSDFIVSLNLLAELFPDTPRTLLALELDELDGDLEKTIASCCRADPDYLRRLSGEKATPITPAKEDKPKGPSAVHSILRPSWVGAGNSHGHLLNNSTVPHAHPINNSTVVDSSSASSRPTWAGAGNPPSHLLNNAAKVKYVKPPPPRPARKGKSTKSAKAKANDTAQPDAPPRRRGMDLAAKLKLKQLREKFNFVDADILEAVFVQSGYKVQATLLCLYDIYPHLREHAAAPANPSYANASGLNASPPGSPELPLSRKREKPDATLPATPTTPTHPQQPNGEKPRKTKRAKEDAGGSANREFITVSYRRKKAEPGANGTPNKKVMDSDDIENTYQSYRDQAFKNSEMRNLMFRQATAAYQAGDGHRARALHQRGREYNQMAEDSHRQACHHIFLECNARLDTLASIDLHGLHVAEALQVISTILELHAQMGDTNNKPKKLRVITGQGRHSLHGIAKIKPAVKNFLRSQGYSFVEADAGVITISLNKI